jgi:hypothetical protein
MKHLCALLVHTLPLAAQRKPDSQIDHLPPNIEILTHFGERADISPDNREVAFMAKSFGDAMMIDLDTRIIRCLEPDASRLMVADVDLTGRCPSW